MSEWKFGIGLIAIVVATLAFSIFTLNVLNTPASTGVCLYKGASSYGLFSSSQGIPIRNVTVVAYSQSIITQGQTDRLGCFIFQYTHKSLFVSYLYQGIRYTDSLEGGTVLQDNLP